jgi:branched-chain amino acid transport system ATP-binding protein
VTSPFFEIVGLSKQFGGLAAVHDVNMTVHEGEIVGLIGPNGAGKTTLFNVITGVYKPRRGRILFRGMNIAGLWPEKICRMGIARTFQIVMPFQTLSVLENTKVAAFCRTTSHEKAARSAMEILHFLGLDEKANVLAGHLTLAQKKRLEMARALATQPQFLLLDETLAGLNATEIDTMIDVVQKIRGERGVTILAVEHVMRAVMKISDRVVVMDEGEKIAEGPPEEVVRNPEVVKAYLGDEYGNA